MKKLICMAVTLLMIPIGAIAANQAADNRTTKNMDLNEYALFTRDSIQKVWVIPADAKIADALKAKLIVNYGLKKNGALEKVELLKSSGDKNVDKALLQAIRAAAPFPPFPKGVAAKSIVIKANFTAADASKASTMAANHDGTNEKTMLLEPTNKKYVWGKAAGASSKTETGKAVKEESPSQPEHKKYKWGL